MTQLITSTIRNGTWEGVFNTDGAPPPSIRVVLDGQSLAPVTVKPDQGSYTVRVDIPAGVLSDGVQTFLVQDAVRGLTIAYFTVITGVSFDTDLRAEVDLLRAELDMLKSAFRRHCLETE